MGLISSPGISCCGGWMDATGSIQKIRRLQNLPDNLYLLVDQAIHQNHDLPKTDTGKTSVIWILNKMIHWTAKTKHLTLAPGSPGIPRAPSAPARPCNSTMSINIRCTVKQNVLQIKTHSSVTATYSSTRFTRRTSYSIRTSGTL